MALHRLTTLTMAVPDVAASTQFLVDFGLENAGGGAFKTRDAGEQLRLTGEPSVSDIANELTPNQPADDLSPEHEQAAKVASRIGYIPEA